MNEKEIVEKFVVKFRKYSKKSERVKKTNQMVIACMTIIKGFLMFGFITQIILGKQGEIMIVIPAAMLAVSIIADWLLYIKDYSSAVLKNVMIYGFLIVYALLNFMNGSEFVILYIIPPLLCCMLYYNKKFNVSIVIAAILIIVIRAVKEMILIGTVKQSEFMMMAITVMTLLFFQWAARVLKQFDHDAMHTMQDEQKRQDIMMKDILDVADMTRTKVEETSDRMIGLKNSTNSVNQSLHEIAQGILSTAESIQEQSEMTGKIQTAVRIAKENTAEVVKSAQTSAEQMNNNTQRMEMLKKQSEDIEAVELDVEKAMDELRAKAEEVSNITKVIFSISDQTTLLALNASIESARAGEAGKGFAVVADEIGKLADQSNTSAEQIRQTIDNLLEESEKSVEVMESVNVLVAEQQEKLNQTREKFVRVSKGITTSKDDMGVIKSHTDSYFVARKKVADIIQNLSAISEEYAASTQQTTASMEELNATMNLLAEASKNLTDLSRQLEEEIAFFQIDD